MPHPPGIGSEAPRCCAAIALRIETQLKKVASAE
jgi:hypothetical protein